MKKRSEKKLKKRLPKARKDALRQPVSTVDDKQEAGAQPVEAQPVLELTEQELSPVLEGDEETTLARAKTLWFFGEWQQLIALDMGSLRANPDRDRFALLIASANQQLGEHEKARNYTRMALDWGCPPRVVAQILIAGVHNTLGRAAALKQDESRIAHHFEASVAAIDTRDTTLVSHARSVREMARMGLLPQAATLVDQQLQVAGDAKRSLHQQEAHFRELKSEIMLLGRELTLAQQSHHFFYGSEKTLPAQATTSITDGNEGFVSDRFLCRISARLLEQNEAVRQAALQEVSEYMQTLANDAQPLSLHITELNTHGHSFHFVHVEEDYIPHKISSKGEFYESQFLNFLKIFHNPKGLIIDGGANIGNHTIYFAKLLGANVVAIEPEPHNATCLAINVVLNGISERVQIFRHAVGEGTGAITLQMNIKNNFGSFTAKADANPNRDQVVDVMQVDVPVTSLDSLMSQVNNNKPISILKLDVEGMELDVIIGAKLLIQSSLPLISVECFSLLSLTQIESELECCGYFPIEVMNVTPTFIFISRNNPFHVACLAEYLQTTIVNRAKKYKKFGASNNS